MPREALHQEPAAASLPLRVDLVLQQRDEDVGRDERAVLQVQACGRLRGAEVAGVQAGAHVGADGEVVEVWVGAGEEGAEGGFAGAGSAWGVVRVGGGKGVKKGAGERGRGEEGKRGKGYVPTMKMMFGGSEGGVGADEDILSIFRGLMEEIFCACLGFLVGWRDERNGMGVEGWFVYVVGIGGRWGRHFILSSRVAFRLSSFSGSLCSGVWWNGGGHSACFSCFLPMVYTTAGSAVPHSEHVAVSL